MIIPTLALQKNTITEAIISINLTLEGVDILINRVHQTIFYTNICVFLLLICLIL